MQKNTQNECVLIDIKMRTLLNTQFTTLNDILCNTYTCNTYTTHVKVIPNNNLEFVHFIWVIASGIEQLLCSHP